MSDQEPRIQKKEVVVNETRKTAVIFGLANKRSIAWAIAQKLSEAGWRLAISYQNERMAQEAKDLVTELPGAEGFMCDVSFDERIVKLFEELKTKYGVLRENFGWSSSSASARQFSQPLAGK